MRLFQRGSILGSVLGIVVCGGIGGLAAAAVVMQLGWDGLPGAIAATVIGMASATGAWIALTSALRGFGGKR